MPRFLNRLSKSRVESLDPTLESRRVSRVVPLDQPLGSRPGSAPGAVGGADKAAGDGARAVLASSGTPNATTALGLDGGVRVRCRDIASLSFLTGDEREQSY